MLSRVIRATPKLASAAAPRRTLHVSAVRLDMIQDLYSREVSSFKPKVLTEKDAEGSVLKWTPPAAPKPPTEDLSVSDVDNYSQAAVEVETAPIAESGEAEPVGDDWFPIENYDQLDGGH